MLSNKNIKLLLNILIFNILIFMGLTPSIFARTVEITNDNIRLSYGEYSRGESFQDTLSFIYKSESQSRYLQPLEAEVTCDCITAYAVEEGNKSHPEGFITFKYDVLPEEKDGPGEKIIYVYTNDREMDILRVVVETVVKPGGEVQVAAEEHDSVNWDEEDHISENTDYYSNGNKEFINSDNPLELYFFLSPNCQSCKRVKEVVLPELENRWKSHIRIVSVNIESLEGFNTLLSMREIYNVQDKKSPFTFFIGKSAITGRKNLLNRLDQAINTAIENEQDTITPSRVDKSAKRVKQVFKSLSFWVIAGAGLIDGINPCAFATIVFFISLLSYAGSGKRQILVVGIGFTLSVFVVYLLLGLGAFKTLQTLSAYSLLSRTIYLLTFIFLVVLFFLALRDTIRYYASGGRTDNQTLQLGRKNKRRIHQVMKRGLKTGNLLLGAVGIGALVSLFEAACTGQVYLPTIVLMLKDETLSSSAWIYLILYNLLFITPLIIVFIFSYLGITSEKFATWSKRNFGVTRIALTLLFLILALLMGFEWFQM